MKKYLVSISIVSHGQSELVSRLMMQLDAFNLEFVELILTHNVPESAFVKTRISTIIVENDQPKGFGENHNQAFSQSSGDYFIVMNPDIVLKEDPFPSLLSHFQTQSSLGVVSPAVLNPQGLIEDNARYFPTFTMILKKLFFNTPGNYQYKVGDPPFFAEWVGGMFMVLSRESFKKLGGFDEKFFLYYEDVDLCARTWRSGMKVMLDPSVSVIHDAQRTSRKNFKYFKWHLASITRYFFRYWLRQPKVSK